MISNYIENIDSPIKAQLPHIVYGMASSILLLYSKYEQTRRQMIQRSVNDPQIWKNNYPIVLIHGYCGTTMDENWILGGYFHYAFSHCSRYLGIDKHSGEELYLQDIYEADVSPIGSAHDRACELYQMLIGERQIRQISISQNLTIAEAVYGKDHVQQHHRSQFYKMRYLKSQHPKSEKMYAFPDGLIEEGKEDKKQRIHFIGHSMGAITVRKLQHLLKTGYFDQIAGRCQKRDRSVLVASLTCISGANNGSLVVNNCGMSYNRNLNKWIMKQNSKMLQAFKLTIICQNLVSSQNTQQVKVKKEVVLENKKRIWEIGFQYQNPIFYDMNVESWGWNRNDNEGRWAHFKRVWRDNFSQETEDLSFVDLNPGGLIKLNTELNYVSPDTYYFSITTGFKSYSVTTPREIFTLPSEISSQAMGFELDFDQTILQGNQLKPCREKHPIRTFLKYLLNPTFSHFSFFQETQTQIDPQQKHMSNVENPRMNNIEAVDYVNSDWVEDNDVCISRKCSEFPRMNEKFRTMFDLDKPQGDKSDPQVLDMMEHPIHQKDLIKKGIWYYGGLPGTDHLDLCGLPCRYVNPMRTILGTEFRMEAWRYIYIRLKLLEFDD